MEEQSEQYFNFKLQRNAIMFIDGNYLNSISRELSVKLDVERLFDEVCKGMFRKRTFWFSALEAKLDRNNNAYRFLDRIRYIPRTKVYIGRMTNQPSSHYFTALRTDAGITLAITMVEKAIQKESEYFILIAGDPEYIPAIRAVQRYGGIVKLIAPKSMKDLSPHPELIKAADESDLLDPNYLVNLEYKSFSDDELYFDDEDIEFEEDLEDFDKSEDEN